MDKYYTKLFIKVNLCSQLLISLYYNKLNNDEDKMEDALRFIKSDEYLLKAFMTLKSPYLRAEALSAVKDSNIKMKHLWRLPSYYKSSVIMSLDDDYLIEKYID